MSTLQPNPVMPRARFTLVAFALMALVALLFAGPIAADDHGDENEGDERVVVRNVFKHAINLGGCDDDDEDCHPMIFVGGSGGFLGVELTRLSPELRSHFGAPEDAGVMISEVVEDSPADTAGLAVGDVIVSVDGEPVRSSSHLARLIRAKDAETPVDIEIVRDHRAQVVRATVEQRERSVIDLGDLVGDLNLEGLKGLEGFEGLEGLEALEHLGPTINGVVSGTLESLNLEGLGEALEGLDLHANSFTFDSEALEEILETFQHAYDSDEWNDWVERIESMDWSSFEARMEELKSRMKALERELHERHEDE